MFEWQSVKRPSEDRARSRRRMTGLPDFTKIALDSGKGAASCGSGGRCGRLRGAGRHRHQAGLHGGRHRRPRLPRHLPRHPALPARPLPGDVRAAAVDGAPVRRLLDGGGFQRLLPAQHRRRPEGPVGRLRSRHPPRLRQRPSARARRRRHGGRRHRFHLRHAHAVLRHPAGADVRVDDHERRGAAGARAVHRRGRGAGRAAGEAVPAPSRTTSSKSSWCGTPTSIRPNPRCASCRTSSATPRGTCRSSTRSRSPAITCRRRARRPTSNSATRSPTASNTRAPASPPVSASTRSPRGCRSSGRSA